MKPTTKKAWKIGAVALALLALTALLVRPRTLYDMAVIAINDGKYDAAYSLVEYAVDAEDERAEELSEHLFYTPTYSLVTYTDGTFARTDYVYENNALTAIQVTGPEGLMRSQRFQNDAAGNMLQSGAMNAGEKAPRYTEKATYDENGNLLTSHVYQGDKLVQQITHTYDAENRVLTTAQVYPDGSQDLLEYVYDELGQVLSEKLTSTAKEFSYHYQYEYHEEDILKRRLIETAEVTVETLYDEEGIAQSKVSTYPDGHVQKGTYVYDKDGLLLAVNYDDGEETTFTYDKDGNNIRRMDKHRDGEWVETTKEFDGSKAIKKTVNESGKNIYTYTYEYGKRNLCTMREYKNETDGTWHKYTFKFDRYGNLLEEVYEDEKGGYTRTLEWQIRYFPGSIPTSAPAAVRDCKATKELSTEDLEELEMQRDSYDPGDTFLHRFN